METTPVPWQVIISNLLCLGDLEWRVLSPLLYLDGKGGHRWTRERDASRLILPYTIFGNKLFG